MELSVILPVYSEEDSLIHVVDDLEKYIGNKLLEIVIVVSPKSNKRSLAICQDLVNTRANVKLYTQNKNPGLGYAVREGFQHISGSHVLIMDSDGEMSPKVVPTMISKMETSKCDMVIASRWIKGGGVVGYNPIKYIFNRGIQVFIRILFCTNLHDLTLGFKLMHRKITEQLKFQSQYHDIALETTIKPIKYGYKVAEVPTVWRCRAAGVSKNNALMNLRYLVRGIKVRVFNN